MTQSQKTAVGNFASASKHIGEFVSKEFAELRKDTIEMNVQRIQLNSKAEYKDIDSGLDPEDVKARVSAANALSEYGRLLLALVEHSEAKELKQAASSFQDSMQTVPNMKITQEQLDIMDKVLRMGGGYIVELIRLKYVKRFVSSYQKQIDKLCDLLINDFSTASEGGTGFICDYENTIGLLENTVRRILRKPSSFEERKLAVIAYQNVVDNKAYLKLVAAKAKSSILAIKEKNSKLMAALNRDKQKIKDIKTISLTIKELGDAVRALSSDN